jgi:ATP-dependent helicase/nuclease subunit A
MTIVPFPQQSISIENDEVLALDKQHRMQALGLDSFIIEAPAGAGKTELLTQRYLKLLDTVETPEEIIAITFTNKAASEMRSRIMDSLQNAANGILPSAPHKLVTYHLSQQALLKSKALKWQLLETPSRLRIYTIDALCGNLARQMPLLSRFGTQPKVAENAELYYQEAATKAIEAMDDAQSGPYVQRVLRYFNNDQYALNTLLVDMLKKREQWLTYTQQKNSSQLAVMALNALIQQELASSLCVLPRRLQEKLMPVARYAAKNLDSSSVIYELLEWQTPLTTDPEDLPFWKALTALLLTNNGGIRKRVDKTIGLPATEEAKIYKDDLKEILNELEAHSDSAPCINRINLLPISHTNDPSWAIVNDLTYVLTIAVAELWLTFQAHNEVDFVEITQRALQALQDTDGLSTELAMRLDYRIQHLLVDEFQDTSPIQIKLLEALTRGWQPNDGRTLFAVGDPMQSIYRFRKANVGLFLQAAQSGIGDIQLTPLKLWRNNRSCPPVVQWINHAFSPIFPKEDNPNQGAIAYRPFVATKEDNADSGITIHPIITSKAIAEEDESPVDTKQLEAERIIAIIQQTKQTKPDATIAVLVRARAQLNALVSEMRRNHPELSFQAVEIEELANRQVVQDLLSLTYALHQRADRVHWLALLRAPWCGLTLADLHALIGNDANNTMLNLMHNPYQMAQLSNDGQNRLTHVRQVMQSALDFKGRTSTSRWVHNTWLRLGGASCLWDKNDVQDVQAFFERIQVLEDNGQFSPTTLADDVKKLYAAPNALADNKLQFMTIHKSKGLEFDTVILPGLEGGTKPPDKALLLWEEVLVEDDNLLIAAPNVPNSQKNNAKDVTPYDYLNSIEKSRATYENARVLYVAVSRAERKLHLLGTASINNKDEINPRKNSFLAMLWPAICAEFTLENALQPIRTERALGSDSIDQFIPKLIRVNEAKTPELLEPENLLLTNTTQLNIENRSIETIHTVEADIGTLTHLYLQMIANQGLNQWLNKTESQWQNTQTAMTRWFVQQGHVDTIGRSASEQVKTILLTSLASKDGQWVLSQHESADNELAIETVSNQHEISKKVIDRTFIDQGYRWIIDYKTTTFANWSLELMQEKALGFAPQLDGYAQLFTHEQLQIKKAIFFVSVGKLVTL